MKTMSDYRKEYLDGKGQNMRDILKERSHSITVEEMLKQLEEHRKQREDRRREQKRENQYGQRDQDGDCRP